MLAPSLLLIGFAIPHVQATIRFGCAQLVTERFDPLVTPGQVSSHVHQIIGGNAFNLTMNPDNDLPKLATCTTCRFKENKSNYWTAVMYFLHNNGSFMRVPQMPNDLVGSPEGGMTVYYLPGYPPFNQKITAFPKGFRMITGDPMLRSGKPSDPAKAETWATSFRCWGDGPSRSGTNNFPPGAGQYDTVHLPPQRCAGGIRANVFFPSCWDGKNADSPDHRSHMAFPLGRVDTNAGIIWHNGSCPASHPVKTPTILFETFWDTRPFNALWPTDGRQPLVLSMGDPTGYGQHGDYLFGWEGDALQRAMNKCLDSFGTPERCSELTIQTDAEINRCIKQTEINEKVEGEYLPDLPGCNPVQSGPAPATMVKDCKAVSTTGGVAAATGVPASRVTGLP